jgi:hypothetical protein
MGVDMTKIDSLTFPCFYTECAYRDGVRDQREGNCRSVPSYMRHGEFEPLGYGWYLRGRKAAELGLVA